MIVIRKTETRFCSLCDKTPGTIAKIYEIFDDNRKSRDLFLCHAHAKTLAPSLVRFIEYQGGGVG